MLPNENLSSELNQAPN